MPHVYYIKNNLNGKMYIGFTSRSDPYKRINEHFSDSVISYNHQKHLYRAIKKYGKDNFSSGVLFSHDDYDLTLQKEIELIEVFSSEYNLHPGGNIPPNQKNKKWKLSEETKSKMRKPKPPRTEEHGKNLSKSLKGRVSPNKGKPGRPGWNKGKRTSGSVCQWKIIKKEGTEMIYNLVLWCEENGYKTNTLKSKYYKNQFPYKDILRIEKTW